MKKAIFQILFIPVNIQYLQEKIGALALIRPFTITNIFFAKEMNVSGRKRNNLS
jgi:hypothetical protein